MRLIWIHPWTVVMDLKSIYGDQNYSGKIVCEFLSLKNWVRQWLANVWWCVQSRSCVCWRKKLWFTHLNGKEKRHLKNTKSVSVNIPFIFILLKAQSTNKWSRKNSQKRSEITMLYYNQVFDHQTQHFFMNTSFLFCVQTN